MVTGSNKPVLWRLAPRHRTSAMQVNVHCSRLLRIFAELNKSGQMEDKGTDLARSGQDRLEQIVDFCRLLDKEKFITRRTYLTDGQRLENDAEHAWHLAVMAMLLQEYSNEEIDLLKVISIVLIHDLVEIYAGDTFAYDTEGLKTQAQREAMAARELFSRLPDDLAGKMDSMWREFEDRKTPESRFAHTLDNFQPLMLQAATGGKAWKEGGRRLSEVLGRNASTASGSEQLWEFAKKNFIGPQLVSGNLAKDTDF